MKIVFFSLLCLILIGMTSYSYAEIISFENFEKNNIKLPEVLLQLELRDSNGSLITYLEAEQIIAIDPLALNRFLDNQNQTNKEFFIKDDKKYEIQQWQQINDRYDRKHAFSGIWLLDIYQNEFTVLLQMRFDSYQSLPGDFARIFWTIIRPVS